MPRRRVGYILAGVLITSLFYGCQSSAEPTDRNKLDTMQKTQIQIKGHAFDVWLALTDAEQEHGLMQVTADQLTTPEGSAQPGMLFVFPAERQLSFWMYNTITPLDIIYIRGDGRIVRKYTMAPLETRQYPSIEPAKYALEVRAGLLDQLGIGPGDQAVIPDLQSGKTVLKAAR